MNEMVNMQNKQSIGAICTGNLAQRRLKSIVLLTIVAGLLISSLIYTHKVSASSLMQGSTRLPAPSDVGATPQATPTPTATQPPLPVKKWKLTDPGFGELTWISVVDGLLYVGSGFSPGSGKIYALNATTGRKLWTFSTGGMVLDAPVIANDVLYIGSDTGIVYALNAKTGKKIWTLSTGGFIEDTPTVSNHILYINSSFSPSSGKVNALNATTGKQIWTFPTKSDDFSSSTVVNGTLYFSDDNVYALNATTGRKIWMFPSNVVESTPIVANGVVYIGSFGDDKVYALKATTGQKIWTFAAGYTPQESQGAQLILAKDVLYVVLVKGIIMENDIDYSLIYALRASTGQKIWALIPGYSVDATVLANTILYLCFNSQVNAFNETTSHKLWTFADCFASGVLAVANGVLYVSYLAHNTLFAFTLPAS